MTIVREEENGNFAHQGQVRRGQPEDQANQASCLNPVTNAVIVWNTAHMGR